MASTQPGFQHVVFLWNQEQQWSELRVAEEPQDVAVREGHVLRCAGGVRGVEHAGGQVGVDGGDRGGGGEVREVFRSSRIGTIAGCLVTDGIIRRNAKARLVRDGAVVAENLTINSLKRFKDDATEVRDGYECGLTLTYSDIKEGDVIETYELVEKERV